MARNSSPSDYALIFSYPGKLAPRDLLVKALQEDAWSITVSALPGVRAYIDIARRVSMLLSRAKRMPRAEAEAAEYKSCWRDLDALYAWASMAAELAIHGGEGDEFGRTNLEVWSDRTVLHAAELTLSSVRSFTATLRSAPPSPPSSPCCSTSKTSTSGMQRMFSI